jgi:hypothetical protein
VIDGMGKARGPERSEQQRTALRPDGPLSLSLLLGKGVPELLHEPDARRPGVDASKDGANVALERASEEVVAEERVEPLPAMRFGRSCLGEDERWKQLGLVGHVGPQDALNAGMRICEDALHRSQDGPVPATDDEHSAIASVLHAARVPNVDFMCLGESPAQDVLKLVLVMGVSRFDGSFLVEGHVSG